MERRSIDAIVRALNAEGVRSLIVGGLAVVAHGYVRFTADLDLIIDFEPDNLRRAVTALAGLGYRPRSPVALEEFLDPAARSRWIAEKGLTDFSLWSPNHPATEVDLSIESPVDFTGAYASALRLDIAPGATATFASLDDLILLKRRAGRPQDLLDIERLERRGEDPQP